MAVTPKLSDLQSQQLVQDGDRVLVRTCSHLNKDQSVKIKRAVRKFMRADVRVLVINCLDLLLIHSRLGTNSKNLSQPRKSMSLNTTAGVANLDCSIVNLMVGDQLIATPKSMMLPLQIDSLYQALRAWAGPEVEVRILSCQN